MRKVFIVCAFLLTACAPSTITTSPISPAPSSAVKSSVTPAAAVPSDTAQDPEQYNNLPLGQSVTVKDTDNDGREFSVSVTAVKMQTSKRAQKINDNPAIYGNPPEHTFLGVLVQFTCIKGLCSYNPYYFTLRAVDGTQLDARFGDGFTPELASGILHKGVRATGWITWDAKAGTYSLEYSTIDNVASWKVNLG